MMVFLLFPVLVALVDLTHRLHRPELARRHYVLVVHLIVNACLGLIRSCVLRAVSGNSKPFCEVNGVAYGFREAFAPFKAALVRIESITGGVSRDGVGAILLRKATVDRRGWRQ